MQSVVITGAARTPMGGFQGVFAQTDAATLGGVAVRAALRQAQVTTVDELLMGCVLPQDRGKPPRDRQVFSRDLATTFPPQRSIKCAALA